MTAVQLPEVFSVAYSSSKKGNPRGRMVGKLVPRSPSSRHSAYSVLDTAPRADEVGAMITPVDS